MKNLKLLNLAILIAMIFALAAGVTPALADQSQGQDDKVLWCHVAENGNEVQLNLPPAALQQAGHMDANGNPLHGGDYAGECQNIVEECPDGQVLVNGVCTTPDPTCPDGPLQNQTQNRS